LRAAFYWQPIARVVIARNSSFAYKGKSIDIKQVGRELAVRYVLKAVCARPPTACALPAG
jgi:TolB-like protein